MSAIRTPSWLGHGVEHPVQRLDMSNVPHDENHPVFFIYRHEDVVRVLRDAETFSSAHIIDLIMGPVMGEHIMLGMDDPQHRRYRALVSTAFRQKVMARWESELVGRVADELVDQFVDQGRADLVTQFTFPYPTLIIAALLGLPHENYRQFQRWSISILSFLGKPDIAIAASQEVKEYLTGILEERRRAPQEDLISALAQAELDGERLSDEEIFSFVRLLLPAGVETTYRSLGNLLYLLLSHPDQLEAVRNDRSLIPQAIEEALRLEAPLLNITRLATRDTEIGVFRFRPVRRSCSCSRQRTGRTSGTSTLTVSISRARHRNRTSPGDMARTSALVCISHEWKCGSRSRCCSTGCPISAWIRPATIPTSTEGPSDHRLACPSFSADPR